MARPPRPELEHVGAPRVVWPLAETGTALYEFTEAQVRALAANAIRHDSYERQLEAAPVWTDAPAAEPHP